jgi:hypothetical protein
MKPPNTGAASRDTNSAIPSLLKNIHSFGYRNLSGLVLIAENRSGATGNSKSEGRV